MFSASRSEPKSRKSDNMYKNKNHVHYRLELADVRPR